MKDYDAERNLRVSAGGQYRRETVRTVSRSTTAVVIASRATLGTLTRLANARTRRINRCANARTLRKPRPATSGDLTRIRCGAGSAPPETTTEATRGPAT